MSQLNLKEWLDSSLKDPSGFWADEAEKLEWYEKWSSLTEPQWFQGAVANLCVNALDRHALGKNRGKAALIWESAESGQSRVLTYWHLLHEVNRFAGALKNMGLMPGGRALIYMPAIPETVIALLACARIGAVSTTIWAGSGILPLSGRIEDFKPQIIVTCDGFQYRGGKGPMKTTLDQAIEDAGAKVAYVVVLDRKLSSWKPTGARDITWTEAVEQLGENDVKPAKLDAAAPCDIVYTSGATGKPRGFVRDVAGKMVALSATMRAIGVTEDDIVMSTSELGSAHGPDDAVFGPMLIGATAILYEGQPDHPTAGAWWDAIEKHGATVFTCPMGDFVWLRRFHSKWITSHVLKSLRQIVVHGETLNETTRKWAKDLLRVPIIEQYRLSEFTIPVLTTLPDDELNYYHGPGVKLDVLDDNDKQSDQNAIGRLVVKSTPPGSGVPWGVTTPSSAESNAYFDTGDLAQISGDTFKLMGRADDAIEAGEDSIGSRLIEEIICSNFVVTEAAIVGAHGHAPDRSPDVGAPLAAPEGEIAAFVILKDNIPGTNPLKDEIRESVKKVLGEAAAPKMVIFIKALPRTPAGKVLHRVLRAMLTRGPVGDLSSIRNPDSLPIVRDAIKAARLK